MAGQSEAVGTDVLSADDNLAENFLFPLNNAPAKTPSRSQDETNYTTESRDPLRRCAICEHYLAEGACELVVPKPKPIEPDGVCDLFQLDQAEQTEMADNARRVSEQVETKGYIYLRVRWVWEIDRLQGALFQLFGYSDEWRWQDPYTYHITLAYSENVTDEQLIDAAKAIIGKTAMRLKVTGIGAFESQGEQAIYLKIAPDEQLAALQRAIYDNLSAQGVELSPFSAPERYTPHLTMAYAPANVVLPDPELEIEFWAEEVCIARSNYQTLAELPLQWADSEDYADRGDAPVVAAAEQWEVKTAPALEIVTEGKTWDAKRAAESVFAAAGFGTENVNAELAQQAFLVSNQSAPTLRSSYRYPVAEYFDDRLWGYREGAAAALEALQSRPELESVREAARSALTNYQIPVSEMSGKREKLTFTCISEMRGKYPDISLPADIDRAALGENAFFVTLPIGQVNAESRNGRIYTENAVKQLVEQINDLRPEGMWGHYNSEEAKTRYDPPAIRWLAAMIDDEGVAWGKGLPLTDQTRDYYRLAKATNARVGTSLVAWAQMDGDEVEALELVTVDLADPARVGVPITAAKVSLSSEMADKPDLYLRVSAASPAVNAVEPNPKGVSEMGNETQVTELTEQRDSLQARVTELEGEKTTLTQQVSELQSETQSLREQNSALLAEYIDSAVDKAEPFDDLRAFMKRDVKREQLVSKEAIDQKIAELLDSDEYKLANKARLEASSGESVGHSPKGGEKTELFPVSKGA